MHGWKNKNRCLSEVGQQSKHFPETILLLPDKMWQLGQLMISTAGASAVSFSPPSPTPTSHNCFLTPKETFQSLFANFHLNRITLNSREKLSPNNYTSNFKIHFKKWHLTNSFWSVSGCFCEKAHFWLLNNRNNRNMIYWNRCCREITTVFKYVNTKLELQQHTFVTPLSQTTCW